MKRDVDAGADFPPGRLTGPFVKRGQPYVHITDSAHTADRAPHYR